MQRYFQPLAQRLERNRPSPGPAYIGLRKPMVQKEVVISDRNISTTKKTFTPAPFL